MFWVGMMLAFLLVVPAGAANTATGDNGSAPASPDPFTSTVKGSIASPESGMALPVPGTLAVPDIREDVASSPSFVTIRQFPGGTWSLYNPGQKIGIAATGTGEVVLAGANGSFTLQLAGIGRPGNFRVAEPGKTRASADRIDILRPGYTEWYASSSAGIEQGMTVETRPFGNGMLIVNYTLAGDLRPVLDGQSLVFFDAAGPVMNYGGLTAHDATGRELPATLSLSSGTLTWQIDDRNAVYPVVIDPWIATQDAVLTASDAKSGNQFGYSVAVSKDGNTVVIGANSASVGAKTSVGQVYVFTKSGGTWSQSVILNSTSAVKSAGFGNALAVSDDGTSVIIGAPFDTANGNLYAGQVYVFQNSGGTWSATTLDASDAAILANFGSSVAISGDGTVAVIGADMASISDPNENPGQAYVFTRSGGTWTQTAFLNASAEEEDQASFGNSVAVSEDGNTVLVGSYTASVGPFWAGRVFVFTRSGSAWSRSAILDASAHAEDGAYFGNSVALSPDGVTAIIGAYGYDSSAGQAYIFTRSGSTWSQAAILDPAISAAAAKFGKSVAFSPDGNTTVIGAYGYDSSVGQAYVFTGSGSTWSQSVILKPESPEVNAQFGYSVAFSGNDPIVGAIKANSGTGAAYVFSLAEVSVAPAVTGVSPASGLNATEKTVTVSGANFDTSASPVVKFTRTGSQNVTLDVVSDTGTALVRKVPANIEAGIWNVTVVNRDGEEGTNASVTYTALAPPRLTGISPTYGGNATATLVTVTGTQFSTAGEPVVNLTQSGYGNITLTGASLSSTSFAVSVPQDIRAGTWGVTVINPDGLEGTNASVTYTALAPPRLTGISPAYGANATATLVTITGSLFNGTAGTPVVNLTASGYSNITMPATNLTSTSLTVSVPNHNIAAVWNVTVVNPDGLEGTNVSVTFTTTDPPPIADFTFDTAAGLVPLTVTFTDRSINEPTSWNWDFGDGSTPGTVQNPVHTYATPGVYSVTLSATNALGTGTKTVHKGISVMSLATQTAILNASFDAAANDNFGTSVAISEDGTTALVGAEFITLGTTPAGKVYVFTKNGGIWSRSAILQASNAANSDAFGGAVAISDDGNTALIGANNANVSMNIWAGQVYVFTRSGGTWRQSAILNASDAADSGHFGESVALSGDGTTALIGAYMATAGASSSAGQAYIFQNTGGSWSERQILNASDMTSGAYFGQSVALYGDTAVIGAYQARTGTTDRAGQAYVFTNSGGIWRESAILNASDPAGYSWFGNTVALSEDESTAFIGAPWATGSKNYAGKAYVFTNTGGTWSQSAVLSTPEVTDCDYFGSSLAVSGNIAVIGNVGDTSPSTAGRAYVFQYDGESWYRTQVLNASDATGYDGFGWSAALHGTTALVGAAWATSGTTADAGQAYFFSVVALEPAPVVTGISPASGANSTSTQVTISGAYFNTTGDPVVKLTRTGFADITLGVISSTGSSLVRTVPAHCAAGTWNVVVTNPDGQEGTNASVTFTVTKQITADFTGMPLSGEAPLPVAFTDTSTGSPTTWSWDFGDGSTSSVQNPSHTYTRAGAFTVSLTASDGAATNTKSVPGYIAVTSAAEPVIANFAAVPRTGTVPLAVSFTDQSLGGPVDWSWSFGDGGTSTEQNPVHTYTQTGSFSVSLTAVNGSYSNTTTQGSYITVTSVPVTTPTTSPITTTTTVPVTTTPAAASDSAGADTSGDTGRATSFVATSLGASAGGTMTFAVNEPLSAGSTGYSYAIRSVSIVPGETLGSTDLLVTDGGSTSNAPKGRTLAGIVAISPVGVNPSAIRSGMIAFAVPSAWLSDHSLAPADIVMLRYHDGAWAELPTTYQYETGGAYYFTATTPGFSYFAIAARTETVSAKVKVTGTAAESVPVSTAQMAVVTSAVPAPVNAAPAGTSAPVTTATTAAPVSGGGSSGIPVLTILAGIGGIAILAVGTVLVRRWWIRRQNPALFREYD